MAENLKVTHYNDGSEIPNITNNDDWINLTNDAYCDYDNNPSNSETYGRLYNWYTVEDSRRICPDGWHVPTHDELEILGLYIGDEISSKLMETGIGGTNESGFTALLGGYRIGGHYSLLGEIGFFWTSTLYNDIRSWALTLGLDWPNIFISSPFHKENGMSIRCVAD